MIVRFATLALVSLVLLHQVFAGVFGGGTVLCVGGAGGLAVQPVGMTCCATHAAGAAAVADPCCPDEAFDSCLAVSATTCAGCTDYILTTRPTLLPPAVASWVATSSPPVVIALVVWPEVSAARTINDRWVSDRAPPPLAFLRTIVLRC